MFEREPTPSDNPLLKPDHVLLTPHTAGATRDGMRKKARAQYENFRHVADGRPLINVTQPYSKVGAEAKAYGSDIKRMKLDKPVRVLMLGGGYGGV